MLSETIKQNIHNIKASYKGFVWISANGKELCYTLDESYKWLHPVLGQADTDFRHHLKVRIRWGYAGGTQGGFTLQRSSHQETQGWK